MGVIQRQSRSNLIIISVAFFLGAIYSIFIVPKVFDAHPEQWGLINLLLRYAQILAIPVLLGFPAVIIRYTPMYAKQEKGAGLFNYSFWICTASFLFISLAWFVWGEKFLLGDNPLYEKYYWSLIPLLLGFFIFELLSAYSRIQQRSVMPFFLNSGLQKMLFFLLLILMYFRLIDFSIFFVFFLLHAIVKPLVLGLDMKRTGTFPRIRKPSLRPIGIPGIRQYALFNALGSVAFLLIAQIDSVMIGNMMGLDVLAYYSIPVFLVSAMSVPEKSLTQISLPVISSLFSQKKMEEIQTIYRKTAVNQFFLGAAIFMGVWVNVDLLMHLLGEKFGTTTLVFLFLGLGKLVDLLTSINTGILVVSEKYKYNLALQILLVVLAIALNLLLIPGYGMEGAAIATAISFLINNTIKTILVYKWYRMHPFSSAILKVILFLLPFFALNFLHLSDNLWLESIWKTALYGVLAALFAGYGNISDELRDELRSFLTKIPRNKI